VFNALAVAIAGVMGFELGQQDKSQTVKAATKGNKQQFPSIGTISSRLAQDLEGGAKSIEEGAQRVASEIHSHVAVPILHAVRSAARDVQHIPTEVSKDLTAAKKDLYSRVAIPIVHDVRSAARDVQHVGEDIRSGISEVGADVRRLFRW